MAEFADGADTAFIDRTYQDAMALAERASSYFAYVSDKERGAMSVGAKAALAAESLRISSRIMHAIAWLLTRKAVNAGEIDEAEALKAEHRLGGRSICLADPKCDLGQLPQPVVGLLEESERLYRRIDRLETQLNEQAQFAGSGNAVHSLVDLIKQETRGE